MRHRSKLLIGIGVLAVALSSTAVAQAADDAGATTEYEVPVVQPEGVAWHAPSKSYFTGAGFEGTIARGRLDEPAAHEYSHSELTGRNSALGMLTDDTHLFVAGGTTGTLFVYDIASGAEVDHFDTGVGAAINDVALAPNGDLYFTDSFRPTIFRVAQGTHEVEAITLTPEIDNGPGFNTNGIRVSKDGEHVLFVDTNDSKLYSMTVGANPAERTITEVALSGGALNGPDGIELLGHDLYVVNNMAETISKIEMSDDFLTGKVVSETTSPRFHTPTTIAYVAETKQLLVANAEFFDPTEAGPPFYVVAIPLP